MRKAVIITLAAGTVLWPLATATAHGGQYRGPSSSVPSPSSSGSSSSSSGSSAGPSTPSAPSTPAAPSAPSSGGGVPSGGGGGSPSRQATQRGMALPDYDLTNWWYWWEYNKYRFLDLRARVHADPARDEGDPILGPTVRHRTLKPSVAQLAGKVTPALLKALQADGQRDMLSSCLVSLAKVGKVADPMGTFGPFMRSADQEIAETAVLALGIAGNARAVSVLQAILADSPKGREAVGDPRGVDYRKRSFAAYALGLLAHDGTDRTRSIVLEAARKLLAESAGLANRDVPVAAINMVRLLAPDLEKPGGRRLAGEAVDLLLGLLEREGVSDLVKAHVPTAVSRLVGRPRAQGAPRLVGNPGARDRGVDLHARALTRLMAVLEKPTINHLVRQSCVLALGEMAGLDQPQVLAVLRRVISGALGSDLQMRFYAYMALGEMGGPKAAGLLGKILGRRGGKRDKPWVALGLALVERRRLERGGRPDPALAARLVKACRGESNPDRKAGLAIALGMIEANEAVPVLYEALTGSQVQSLKGYSAIALGMIGAREAVPTLKKILVQSVRKPVLFQQLAVALGLLGDKTTVPELIRHLREGPKTLAAQSSVASALGFVGDSRAIAPLLHSLTAREVSAISRAFAAVALGLVGDKANRPWNAKIASGINYRASVETLVGSANGVLDIL